MQGLVYWGCAEGKLGCCNNEMKSQIVANVELGITGVFTHRFFNLRKMYHDPYMHGEVMSYHLHSATVSSNNPQGH